MSQASGGVSEEVGENDYYINDPCLPCWKPYTAAVQVFASVRIDRKRGTLTEVGEKDIVRTTKLHKLTDTQQIDTKPSLKF